MKWKNSKTQFDDSTVPYSIFQHKLIGSCLGKYVVLYFTEVVLIEWQGKVVVEGEEKCHQQPNRTVGAGVSEGDLLTHISFWLTSKSPTKRFSIKPSRKRIQAVSEPYTSRLWESLNCLDGDGANSLKSWEWVSTENEDHLASMTSDTSLSVNLLSCPSDWLIFHLDESPMNDWMRWQYM